MADKVWCVFQKLPGESCPSLSAICGSPEVAEGVARISEAEERDQGVPVSEWTVRRWDVLDSGYGEIEDIQHISDVLDPMRAGTVPLDGSDGEDGPAS